MYKASPGKKLWLLMFVSLLSCATFSQKNTDVAVYKRFPTIPKFSIIKCPDNSVVTREDLKKVSTLVIFFSPTCDHCKRETADLLSHQKELDDMQVLMVSTLPMPEISNFYYEMHLQNEPSIIVGMDPKYFFPVFYQVQQLPALILYNKKGELVGNVKSIQALFNKPNSKT